MKKLPRLPPADKADLCLRTIHNELNDLGFEIINCNETSRDRKELFLARLSVAQHELDILGRRLRALLRDLKKKEETNK